MPLSYLSQKAGLSSHLQLVIATFSFNKAIKDGGSTAGLPPNNKQKDHQ